MEKQTIADRLAIVVDSLYWDMGGQIKGSTAAHLAQKCTDLLKTLPDPSDDVTSLDVFEQSELFDSLGSLGTELKTLFDNS